MENCHITYNNLIKKHKKNTSANYCYTDTTDICTLKVNLKTSFYKGKTVNS